MRYSIKRPEIENLFEEFIRECEYSKKLRHQTLHGYSQVFKSFMKLMPSIGLEDLKPATITEFFQLLDKRSRQVGKTTKQGVKKSTIATYWSKLNSFCEWLLKKELIAANPFKQLDYPTPTYDDKKFLKREEIEKIITAITLGAENSFALRRDLVIAHLLLLCGLRRSELLGLQIRDIDFIRKTVTVRGETSKSGRARIIPLHSTLFKLLKDYFLERKTYKTQFLILSTKKDADSKLTHEGFRKWIKKINVRSGIRFHPHQFRHTFAVNFLIQSNNIYKVKELLGHKDIRMTEAYLRCIPTDQIRQDIESMNIDRLI